MTLARPIPLVDPTVALLDAVLAMPPESAEVVLYARSDSDFELTVRSWAESNGLATADCMRESHRSLHVKRRRSLYGNALVTETIVIVLFMGETK